MTTKEKIEIMKAYAEGKKIQWRVIGRNGWFDLDSNSKPIWNWKYRDYRIKPEPAYLDGSPCGIVE